MVKVTVFDIFKALNIFRKNLKCNTEIDKSNFKPIIANFLDKIELTNVDNIQGILNNKQSIFVALSSDNQKFIDNECKTRNISVEEAINELIARHRNSQIIDKHNIDTNPNIDNFRKNNNDINNK